MRFAFELGAAKTSGGQGWADVAKLGYFGWEYKAKDADLDKVYYIQGALLPARRSE